MSLPSTRSRSQSVKSNTLTLFSKARRSKDHVDLAETDPVAHELYGKSTCRSISRSGWLMMFCTFLTSFVEHRLIAAATISTNLTSDGEYLFENYMSYYIFALTIGIFVGGMSDFLFSRKSLVVTAHITMIVTFFVLYMSYDEEMIGSSDRTVMCIFTSVHGIFRVLLIESFGTKDRMVISMGVGISKLIILVGRLASALLGTSIYIITDFGQSALTNATVTWINISGVVASATVISIMAHFVRMEPQVNTKFSTATKLLLTGHFKEIRDAWQGNADQQEAVTFRMIRRFMLLVLLVVPCITAFFIGNCSLYMFRTSFSLMHDDFNWPTLLTMDVALWAFSIPFLVIIEFVVVQVVCKILRRDPTLSLRILMAIFVGFAAIWGTLFFLEAKVHQVTGNLPTATTTHVRFINALNHPVNIVPKDGAHATHLIPSEGSVVITYTKLEFKTSQEELFEIELHAVTDKPYKYATFIAMKYKFTTVYLIWNSMELRRVEEFEPLFWPTAELAYGGARVYFATLHDSKYARLVLTPHSWNEFSKSRELMIVEVPQGERKVFHIVPGTYMMSFELTSISEYVTFERHGIYGIVYYTQVPGGRVDHYHMYTILPPIRTSWIYASLLQALGYSSAFFFFIKIEVFLFVKSPAALRGIAFSIFRFCEDAPFLAGFLTATWYYGENLDFFFGYMVIAVHGGFVIATIFILVKFKHFFRD